jgi:ATP-dependent helicase/nuclease subunit A
MSARFNPGQQEAVASRADRVVVSAGAGSGKTRVLVQRFVDRVLEQEAAGSAAPIRSVLLITFTDKAAGELAERVRRALLAQGRADLAREVDSAWISTIHGFCARIVRRHALELGVDPGFAVLADPRTGLVRTEAFERAAIECLSSPETGDATAQLVEEGVADLRKLVIAACDSIRSKGIEVGDVVPTAASGLGAPLRGLLLTLDEVLPRYRRLKQTATVTANLAGFVRLREEAAKVQALAPGREAAEAVFGLADRTGSCRGDEETKDLTRQVNESVTAVVSAATDVLASQAATAAHALLSAFAREYEAAKRREGALDFEDLQLLARRLWVERPDVAARIGGRFVEIMVDEFQDTNVLQLEVIAPISRHAQCVVGDVQQSIYRFRDADVALLRERVRSAEDAKGGHACRLTVNYRSNGRLLRGLNGMFGSEDFFGEEYLVLESGAAEAGALPKRSVRWDEDAPRIEAIVVDKALCEGEHWRAVEARALAGRLHSIVGSGLATPDDIVVLVRASTTMPVYVDALREAGFDVIAPSSGGFYATPEYGDVRALLRVLANPLDDEGVLGLLAGGFGGLSDDALLLLARGGDSGLWAALDTLVLTGLSERDAGRARLVVHTVNELRGTRARLSLADSILYAASVLGPDGGLMGRPDAWANVRKAVRLTAEFESQGSSDPATLLRHFEDRQAFVAREPAAGVAVEGSGTIRVMTVHAAKGLEFPVVAVADLGHEPATRYPSILLSYAGERPVIVARGPRSIGGEKAEPSTAWQDAVDAEKALDLEESKRVFYVACTRAEQVLLLSGAVEVGRPARAGVAADWVLEAARRAAEGPDAAIALTVVGPDDIAQPVPLPPHRSRAAKTAIGEGEPQRPVRLAQPPAIPAPREVSYTALALFERCAYRFFAERMLRVGSLVLPKADDPLEFGNALHGALELEARGECVGAADLARLVAAHRLPEGSLERLTRAVESLRRSGAGALLAVGIPEYPFAVRVDGGVVRGTMDLVARQGDAATVLDYKTGATWDATGARYEAQAQVYALALLEAGAASVLVRFVHVEAGCEEMEYRFTAADRPAVLARIDGAFERMRAGDFAPLTAYEPSLCADCPVSGGLCPVVHPHARGRGRAHTATG